jgi:hypothetical protein
VDHRGAQYALSRDAADVASHIRSLVEAVKEFESMAFGAAIFVERHIATVPRRNGVSGETG